MGNRCKRHGNNTLLPVQNNENDRTKKYLYGSTKDKKSRVMIIESRKKTLDEVRLMKNPGRVLCTVRYMEKDFQFAVLGFHCLLNLILLCIEK